METITTIKNEGKKSVVKTMHGSLLPQLEISGRRIGNTNSTDILLLLPTLNAMNFKTTVFHRGTTPIGQRLDEEFN